MLKITRSALIKHFIFVILVLSQQLTAGAGEYISKDIKRSGSQKSWVVLPYIFSSDSMGLTAGAVGIFNGYIQPQMNIVASTFVGEEFNVKVQADQEIKQERAAGAMIAVDSYQSFFSERMFITAMGAYGYYPNQRLYLDGSNDSKRNLESNDPSSSTPFKSQGYNNWFDIDFRYVMPWGESADQILPVIQLNRGIAVNRDEIGGRRPFSTGQTIFGSKLFYSKWSAEKLSEAPSINTNGVRFYLEHNNTDYPSNPSRGYSFKGQFSADVGIGNSTQSWNSLEFDYAHYIELLNFSWTRQNVIAFNAWTAYSPSWKIDETINDDGILEKHQTPMWEGARLGGWNRMRAYDNNRFSDKAAVYTALEYRIIPEFNPMQDQNWSPFAIDWFQTVLFVEAGRVAESYDISTLFSDMKYDVGFSLRALAAKVPVRFEYAHGSEGSSMWVMLNQPF
ncbi:BamA/TamA family outer membrane protein [Psychromonas ossibalaenae]|uniref:BamA/TamA family outer membrane protein n=1 Tax=Psychromonas ossibalaenae TaxID=444922 RepID=UPI00037D3CB3|nr:BamA/TamA family outer membrane protein [Psychromonas ossibalaenae]